MKKTIWVLSANGWLNQGGIVAQVWMQWKADSAKMQLIYAKNGSNIKTQIMDGSAERVTIKLFSQLVDLPTDSIQTMRPEDRVALRIEGNRPYAANYMFFSESAFFLPYYMTKKTEESDVAATAYLYGSLRGIAHGYSLFAVAAGEDHWNYRAAVGAMVAASIGEGVGFYYLSDQLSYTGGRLMRKQNFTTGQGFMIRLSMLAGYGLMFYSTAATSENTITQQTQSLKYRKPSFNFNLNPISLLTPKTDRSHSTEPFALLQIFF